MSIDYRGNPWDMSGINQGCCMYSYGCLTTRPDLCEASCAAFDATFPATPAGYSIANPSGTTASGLGVRRCADGYCGVAEVACGSGGAFEAPSGCAGATCTAFSTTFPTTPAGYTVARAATSPNTESHGELAEWRVVAIYGDGDVERHPGPRYGSAMVTETPGGLCIAA